jgi:DNA-binding transcriptional LysR family regulator
MNLNLLRVFVTVVDTQSFTRAAEALEISQPAVSKAVRELESQLETLLLERKGRSMRTSEPGRALYAYGRSIFALEREADEAVRAYCALDRGQLTIGASTTIATYWLPPRLVAFQRLHPGIGLSLVSANTRRIAELLLDCEIDVALVEGPIADARLETRPWREEEMIVVAPGRAGPARSKALKPAALAGEVWVLRERGSGSREVTDAVLAGFGITAPRTIEVGSNEAVVQTVAAGMGLGLVPRICARDQLALGRVRELRFESGPIRRQLHRVRLPQRPVSQAALAFEAMIAADGAATNAGAPA